MGSNRKPVIVQLAFKVPELGYCHECISHCKSKNGYVQTWNKGKQQSMHRYIYELNFGMIPKGLVIRHKCDNPSCINPEHLELGTHQDNSNDMKLRGRANPPIGERQWQSKLKEEQVRKILLDSRKHSEIAEEYKVSRRLIDKIKRGEVRSNG